MANITRASRKDVRDAVKAARKAQPGWAGKTAYNRGQVLYRAAEALESRARVRQQASLRGAKPAARAEVAPRSTCSCTTRAGRTSSPRCWAA